MKKSTMLAFPLALLVSAGQAATIDGESIHTDPVTFSGLQLAGMTSVEVPQFDPASVVVPDDAFNIRLCKVAINFGGQVNWLFTYSYDGSVNSTATAFGVTETFTASAPGFAIDLDPTFPDLGFPQDAWDPSNTEIFTTAGGAEVRVRNGSTSGAPVMEMSTDAGVLAAWTGNGTVTVNIGATGSTGDNVNNDAVDTNRTLTYEGGIEVWYEWKYDVPDEVVPEPSVYGAFGLLLCLGVGGYIRRRRAA